jgi:DNA polymerase III delta prime subunit
MALCAATTFGFDPLEINASKSIRSFEDVDKIRDSTRNSVNILSFLNGNRTRKTCVILDEVDGSDPHAQNKIIDWIRDKNRTVPILCTGNELPTVFKRNSEYVELVKCFPPRAQDIQTLFPDQDVPKLLKECQYDIRRMIHRIQYGISDILPKFTNPRKDFAPNSRLP